MSEQGKLCWCGRCDSTFTRIVDFKQHIDAIVPCDHVCPCCRDRFETRQKFVTHALRPCKAKRYTMEEINLKREALSMTVVKELD